MIKNKNDYKYYIQMDCLACKRKNKKAKIFGDEIWKFQLLLRKREYESNCLKGFKKILFWPVCALHRYQFHILSIQLGFSIPLNSFDEGLSIAHYGTIIVNGNAHIGKFCRIQTGVTIGTTNGSDIAPKLGNYIFIGEGSKIIGNVQIADEVAIGANSVVVKDIIEPRTTWGGVPARKISNNSSRANLLNLNLE